MTIEWGVRPSNGTMGDMMRAQTCDQCTVDHGWHVHLGGKADQPDESCPIMLEGLCGESPKEWGHDYDTGRWVCGGFEGPCRCHRGDDPEPPKSPKPIPGQGLLFAMEPHPLLHADTAEREEVLP